MRSTSATTPVPSRPRPDRVPSPTAPEVRVLGPVGVSGAARPFHRAGSLELVVYLAMHPGGAATDAWATALWPDRLMAAATLHSTASAARRSLGRSPSGLDYLPHRHGRLALAPDVVTDWDRFRCHAGRSSPEGWRAALALVRGRPFDGMPCLDWPILEGHGAEIEDAVVRTAVRLGRHHLDTGDGPGAAWAAHRGLAACPYDERLYRLLLQAADLEGNQAGVESAMARLLQASGAFPPARAARPPRRDGQVRLVAAAEVPARLAPALLDQAVSGGWVHEDTAALYRTLSAPATRGVPVRL